jgi:hypothetical protein
LLRLAARQQPHAGLDEHVLNELRQVGSGCSFDLGEEGRGVLPHQAVQRDLFRAVTLVVDRRTIRRPVRPT